MTGSDDWIIQDVDLAAARWSVLPAPRMVGVYWPYPRAAG